MQKETIIAKIRASVGIDSESLSWWGHLSNNELEYRDYWFLQNSGQAFLSEFRGIWERELVNVCEEEISNYFTEIGLQDEFRPKVKITETFQGSWIMDAVVTISSTIGGTYAAFKGVSEIPDIVEGLEKLKNKIVQKYRHTISTKTKEIYNDFSEKYTLPPPKDNIVTINDFVIDARPLLALKPDLLKSHSIHLSVAINSTALTIENLGEEPLENINIGIFNNKNKINNYQYAYSYQGYLNFLSPKQTISKNLLDFKKPGGEILKIEDLPSYVDIWIQDNFGIYLFNFLLD